MAASVMIPGQNGRPQQQQPSGPGTGAGGALIDFGPMHMLHAPSPPPRDAAAELREAQLSMRVKELEEVVRGMRVENEKQVRSSGHFVCFAIADGYCRKR
jgi:hypothetical protein